MNGEVNGDAKDVNGITDDISHVLYDTKDFQPYDASQEIIFPPELKVKRLHRVIYVNNLSIHNVIFSFLNKTII